MFEIVRTRVNSEFASVQNNVGFVNLEKKLHNLALIAKTDVDTNENGTDYLPTLDSSLHLPAGERNSYKH